MSWDWDKSCGNCAFGADIRWGDQFDTICKHPETDIYEAYNDGFCALFTPVMVSQCLCCGKELNKPLYDTFGGYCTTDCYWRAKEKKDGAV